MSMYQQNVAVLAALALVFVGCDVEENPEPDEPGGPGEPATQLEQPAPTGGATGAMIPVSVIATAPERWSDSTVSGQAQVTEVISDGGFWIGQRPDRMLVVIDPGGEEPPNIQQGQTIRIDSATVRTPQDLEGMSGLDQQAQGVAGDQGGFLFVDGGDIRITEGRDGGTGGAAAGGDIGSGDY